MDPSYINSNKSKEQENMEEAGSVTTVKAIMDAHKQPFGVYNTAEGVAFWFCLKKAPKEETDVQENANDTGSME